MVFLKYFFEKLLLAELYCENQLIFDLVVFVDCLFINTYFLLAYIWYVHISILQSAQYLYNLQKINSFILKSKKKNY